MLENGFESLCKIANVQATENRERKRKLIGKFKKLSSKIAFPVELSFEVSSGRRWAYTPKITFPPPHTGDIMRRGDNKDARANILLENFLHELIALIKSKYPEGFETGKNKLESIIKYCRWASGFEEKNAAYLRAQTASFETPSDAAIKRAPHIALRLTKVRTAEDIKLVITGNEL